MSEGTETRKERNIVILFLSNFIFSNYKKDMLDENGNPLFDDNGEKKQEDRKCLLPSGRYRMEALSKVGCGKTWVECIQTNEAPIKDILLTLNGQPLDAIFCLVSDKVGGRSVKSNNIKVWKSKSSEEFKTYPTEMKFFLEERLPSINEDPEVKDVLKKPLTEDIFREVEFHESADDPAAESIRTAIEMEEAIKKYIKEENEKGNALSIKDCHIYADITGGKRTANMAMSAAMQLLQYDGAILERVVYSDYDRDRQAKENEEKPVHPVSDVQPITDLYLLVAGVDAFTKYGSSKALDEYFEDVRVEGEALDELLKAMKDYSEAVTLCRPKDIRTTLAKFVPMLRTARKENSTLAQNPNAKVRLFVRMLDSLYEIYSKIMPEGATEIDRFEVIKWCAKNNLVSQALTLCTEWLPAYLVNYGAVYTEDTAIQEYCKQLNKEGDKPTKGRKGFIMNFCVDSPNSPIAKTNVDILADAIRQCLIENLEDASEEGESFVKALLPPLERIQAVQQEKTVLELIAEKTAQKKIMELIDLKGEMPKNYGNLDHTFVKRFVTFLHDVPTRLKRAKTGSLRTPHGKDDEIFLRIIDKIEHPNNKKARKIPLNKIIDQDVFDKIKKWQAQQFQKEFKSKPPMLTYHYPKNDKTPAENMLACSMIQTDFRKSDGSPDKEKALKFITGYTHIRKDLRNKVNHADEETAALDEEKSSETLKEIQEFLQTTYLPMIQDLIKDENGNLKPMHKFENCLWAEDNKEATS